MSFGEHLYAFFLEVNELEGMCMVSALADAVNFPKPVYTPQAVNGYSGSSTSLSTLGPICTYKGRMWGDSSLPPKLP